MRSFRRRRVSHGSLLCYRRTHERKWHIQMPPVFRALADTEHLGLPGAAFNSNIEQDRSIRANTAITLSSTADLTVTGSYLSNYQETPDAERLYSEVLGAPALGDPAHYYGYAGNAGNGSSSAAFTPLSELSAIGSQNTDRLTGGLAASWRPTGWFVGHAAVSITALNKVNSWIIHQLIQRSSSYLRHGLSNTTNDIYSVGYEEP